MSSSTGVHYDGCSCNPGHSSTSTATERRTMCYTLMEMSSRTDNFTDRAVSGVIRDHLAASNSAIAAFTTQFNAGAPNNGPNNGGNQPGQ